MKKIFTILPLLALMSPVAKAQVITNGLYAYYPFNNNAIDESVNNFDGNVGTATLTYDRFGITNSAYSFHGNPGDTITMDLPSASINFSVCFWLKPDEWGTDSIWDAAAPLEWRTTESSNPNPMFSTNLFAGEKIRYMLRHLDYNITSTVIYEPCNVKCLEGWFHVAYVFDAPNVYIYVNGIQVASSTFANPQPWLFNKLMLGDNYWTHLNPQYNTRYKGAIDDIYIFNRGINPKEVWDIYTETHASSILKTAGQYDHLIALYPNPNPGMFTIDLSKMPRTENFLLTVTDVKGTAIYEKYIDNSAFIFDRADLLQSGNYIVNIKDKQNNQIVFSKMILINK